MARKLLTMKKKKPVEQLEAPEKKLELPSPPEKLAIGGPDKPAGLLEEKPKQSQPRKKKKPKKKKVYSAHDSPVGIAARELLEKLTENHPKLFPTDGTPPCVWKIGLRQDVMDRYETARDVTEEGMSLWRVKNLMQYQDAIAAGGDRYDLDGNPTEPISEENMADAKKFANVLRAKHRKWEAREAKKAAKQAVKVADELAGESL